jgi:TetR/AcrR family transcriptional regulator, cholesterol catabolism regulator
MTTATISTKKNIRQTAEKLFRERGYAAIGMRELAREVGIEAPSIYNHYKSKDDLLREICFDIADQFFKAFEEAEATEDKPVKKLKAVMQAHVGVIARNMEASEVFFSEWMFLEEPNLSKFKKMRYEYEMRFREIIEKGIKQETFRKMNSKLAAFVIFSALNATHDLHKSNERMKEAEIADEISNLILKGLKA